MSGATLLLQEIQAQIPAMTPPTPQGPTFASFMPTDFSATAVDDDEQPTELPEPQSFASMAMQEAHAPAPWLPAQPLTMPVPQSFHELAMQEAKGVAPWIMSHLPNPQVLAGSPFFVPAMVNTVALHRMSPDLIASAAAHMEGRQYWSNSCAHAVHDCLRHLGINLTHKTNGNPNWVPNYAHVGHKVERLADLQPGDLVIYHNGIGQGGYDHIGIYAGDGMAWNVSSAHGHRWAKTPIGHHFQEGRRLA